jgi:dihydroorotate dehydrogenase (NAD+) catalytic subunit
MDNHYFERIVLNLPNQLEVKIAGLKLLNPTMLAAGVLGLTEASLREAADNGAGAVITKSVGLEPRTGYSNPSVVQVSCGLLNAIGLPNPGVRHFKEEIEEIKQKGVGVPVIASVFGFSIPEFADVAHIMAEGGADAIELNVSCPHVEKTGSEIGQHPDLVSEIVRKVKGVVNKPVIVKLTPNVANIVELAQSAVKAGADAITAINTVRAMAIEIETARPILANKIGGLSGPAIKPIAIRCVYEIYEAVNVPIIGCGGITTWQDAVEFMLAGASAVQIATAIASEGIGVFKSINKGIASYLQRKDFMSVNQIVGLAHKR